MGEIFYPRPEDVVMNTDPTPAEAPTAPVAPPTDLDNPPTDGPEQEKDDPTRGIIINNPET